MSFADALRYRLNVNWIGRPALRLNRLLAERFHIGAPRWESQWLSPPLQAAARNKELIARHWLEGRYANPHRKVAWVTSGGPVELLKALGFYLLYPENHGAICGTARVAVDLASRAEDAGYSRDVCSYARTDLGTLFSGRSPVGRLPRPDLLLACTNICQTVLFWYRVLASHFHVPLILIDTPFVYFEESPDYALRYVERQLEEAIPVAEKVAGKALKMSELAETARLSKLATELWLEILERNRHHPAPISTIDQFTLLAPIVEMRGDRATVDFYAAALREVEGRIARGVGAVKQERKRVLWDNLPIWYRLRFVAEALGEHGIALVASTYARAWGELAPYIDAGQGLASMARVYTYPILNRGAGHKLSVMKQMIHEYDLDGAVLHSDRSCKPYSIGQIDQRDRLARELRVPALLLDGDHNDSRVFSDELAATRLAAFAEMLEG